MTPENQNNGNPLIYRFLDSLGILHQVVPVEHTHRELIGPSVSLIVGGTEVEIETSDLPNLIRALADPDTTPTASSDKLVTSGGVKTALDAKMNNKSFDSKPTENSNNLLTSGNIYKALRRSGHVSKYPIINYSGPIAFENIVGWYTDGEVELHYLVYMTSGSPVPVKNIWKSTSGVVFWADELGEVSTTRWPVVTIRRSTATNEPTYFVVTLDGVITPT